MMLRDLLSEKRARILDEWFDAVLATYPADAARFLMAEKDRFANPVRHTILQGLEGILGKIVEGREGEDGVNDFLDHVIRIRSVQDFSPSEALAFIFALKGVLRKTLQREIREQRLYGEMLELESRIDGLALRAFDVYMRCREQIYELRVKEVKGQKELALRLLEKTNRILEDQRKEEGSRLD